MIEWVVAKVMGKIKGFLEVDRHIPDDRPVAVRLKVWNDVHVGL